MSKTRGRRTPISHEARRSTLLEPAVQRYGNWLQARAYSPFTVDNYKRMVRHLGWWMTRQRRGQLKDVNEALVGNFITRHLPQCRCYLSRFVLPKPQYAHAAAALRGFLTMLREEGAISRSSPGVQVSPVSLILDDFGDFLRQHRGATEGTIGCYRRYARRFLESLPSAGIEQAIRDLTLDDIRGFALARAKELKPTTRQNLRGALVVFFHYLRVAGYSRLDVKEALPRARRYRLSGLPVAISREQVECLLQSVDRSARSGRRDYAMLLLFATYGLRSREVTRLRIEDIDWRHQRLLIRAGKNRRERVLPLTRKVGDALYDYLRKERRRCTHREVFLTERPPCGPFRANPYHMVFKYFLRSGIESPHRGAHTLRHSLAVEGVRAGLPLKMIGDVLGHRDPDTTAIYTKLHLDDLRQVALELGVSK